MHRITAIGAGAVDYLLRGCDDPAHDHRELADRADSAELGADRYFAKAMEAGEPAGRWFGSGWAALGIDIQVGGKAAEDDVRAIFGQLRRPESSERDPVYIGSKPRTFTGYGERLAKLQAKEPDASPERLREMEREAVAGGTRAVAYYDHTFSPAKSISVLYAAYLAAGLPEEAAQVRAAHEEAVRIALSYAEQHCAMTRFGKTEQGREYVQADGLAAVLFTHHTSREGEPQLHAHAGVLNRVATAEGKVGALDGKAFRPFKEAIAAAYDRAVEQGMTDRLGTRFELRPDGLAREIAGMDPELIAEASTRRGQVVERVEALVEQYRDRHGGREPGAAARKAMTQEATLDTRAAKTGLAGPAAVAAWNDRTPGRRDRLAAAVTDVDLAAMAAALPVAAGREQLHLAMAAGLADVQGKYATWQLGNLADAIDHHLGDASALGVTAAERPAALEALARQVIDPASGFGVVQLNAHEAARVPEALCRADGRPVWRPHEERRFATVEHLGFEAGVAAFAGRGGARQVDLELIAPVLERAGLSADQDAAVRGILTSDRHGAVLVGPAGTGKSRTVGTLAQAWTASIGGTVYGVATAQIATSNLEGDGLTALNTKRFIDAVTPDPVTGRARRPLDGRDLVVVDEASMASTPHLAAITTAAARVGAKVVYVGDPAQLDAPSAGGLFTHLVERLPAEQVHTLDQPHRFAQPWEAEASMQLRAGDQCAVEAYNDRGRLMAGPVEEMAAAARRGWLADRLDGMDAVLVVGSNKTAADMSGELRTELASLGRVQREALTRLADRNDVGIGDIVEARRNAWTLRVDPSPEGVAKAVMNRGRYTILGRGDDGTILGRDRHGGIAHLPVKYLQEHAALGYAVTGYGAEGVTADAGHGLVDRDATREATYVQASRGRAHNYLYLVTEREPDAHEPQRVNEVAAERLTRVLEVSGAQRAATEVAALDETERHSAPVLLARLERAGRAGAQVHLDHVRERLGTQLDREEHATERLVAALRAVELDGHDPAAVLDRAIESRGFDDVDSIAGVLAHRVRGAALAVDPDRDVDPTDWTSRVRVRGLDELDAYARDVTGRIEARQAELGDRVATEAPAWAVTLGERPDPELDPGGDAAWRRGAGVTAFYRESASLDPEQVSLGAAPSPDRPVEAAVYEAALAVAEHAPQVQPEGRDWRREADVELYAARERWARELEQGPAWVADELGDTHTLARGYREDAVIERARAQTLTPDDPAREQITEDAERAARFAEQYEAEAAQLEDVHQRRASWWEASAPQRDADAAAASELGRRGLPPERVIEPDPAEPDPQVQPEPGPGQLDHPEPQLEVELEPVAEPAVEVEPEPPALPDREAAQLDEPEPHVAPEPAHERAPQAEPEAVEQVDPEVDVAAGLAQAREAQRQAELDALEREAAHETTPPEPELAPEPGPESEPSLDELARERDALTREPAQLEREMDDGLEPEM